MGDKIPYPTWLGIDWAFEYYVMIEIKRETMNFEMGKVMMIHHMDPYQGSRFTQPINDREEPEL